MILSYSASPRLPVCLATQLYSMGPWLLAHYPRMCDFWDTIVPTASLQFRVDDLQTKTLSLRLVGRTGETAAPASGKPRLASPSSMFLGLRGARGSAGPFRDDDEIGFLAGFLTQALIGDHQ